MKCLSDFEDNTVIKNKSMEALKILSASCCLKPQPVKKTPRTCMEKSQLQEISSDFDHI